MDPVSRRLAAAAMGLAFGLSRDEELEKTRLDLERARMEREDFRNGAGPVMEILHESQVGWGKQHFARMYAMGLLSNETANKRRRTEANSFDEIREALEHTRGDLGRARILMSKVVSEFHNNGEVSRSTVDDIVDCIDSRWNTDSSDDADSSTSED